MNLKKEMFKLAKGAKEASISLAKLDSGAKNRILRDVAKRIKRRSSFILAANAKDIRLARTLGISSALCDRLRLDEKRLGVIINSLVAVANLADPVGKTLMKWRRPNGVVISKVSVPLGVVAIIYEARPNVTTECASLCLKSGNSVILRGGKEAYHTNKAFVTIFKEALRGAKVPDAAVSFVEVLDHKAVDHLLQLDELINVVIPRGGEGLIRKVVSLSKIPVIKHYKGICHLYIDKDADLKMAERLVVNAKCQRPAVCNAMETLLVHRSIARRFLPQVARALRTKGCVIKGCDETRKILKTIGRATVKDWATEYLDLILSVRVVSSVDEAIRHIQAFGSAHTDGIVTRNRGTARKFMSEVDSSSVMVNCSTRLSDGFQYGFGAEIGISTDKLHARGPMGLDGLTSYKYVVEGNGQIRT
ncbi:MAG: glutamate-5-semialdehyde dehydrogenase [Candidatus Omnitrophica bacterium]|nr:glutamate-5-semialdehyde dehydrogenase [Candidatus Omnitrophota bacterium]